MTKPIDLIVANVMHDAVDAEGQIDVLVNSIARLLPNAECERPDILAETARQLLCRIAHNASLADVFKALAAIGAPSSKALIREGLQAVKDRQ